MTATARDTAGFLLPTVLYALAGAVLLALAPKGEAVLYLDAWHGPAGDALFRYATWMGDGLFWVAVVAVLFLHRWRSGLLALAATGASALVVQGLKNVFRSPRPVTWFGESGAELSAVAGITHYGWMSFPSGHTGAAFAGFFVLAFLYGRGRPAIGVMAFLAAAAVAVSRVYLGQHFALDVYAGGLLGTVTAWVVVSVLRNRRPFRTPAG